MEKDGVAKHILIRLFALSAVGLAVAAAAMRHRHRKRELMGDARTVPRMRINESGRVEELENFGQYVARQLGFVDPKECPTLCKLASDYLKKSKTCEEDIYSFCGNVPHLNPDDLCVKLLEEIDKCILGYFAFHWTNATLMITKALGADKEPKKKFKSMVMEATRDSRFKRITKSLKVTRVFSTLVEEMKAIGIGNADDLQRCTEVMVPADRSQRSPVLLLMGGGMGAGKSTVLKDILRESFWSGTEPVVVEADAFKESDVIYRALSSRGHHNDMLQTAELVHQSSTDAASSLLVTALNEGRDVIMDGTLSWEPFVEQTIAMARSVHLCRYRMGLGYKVMEDGTTVENYWEPVEDDNDRQRDQTLPRKPYRIELVGVMCDAYLAVVRGIRRAVMIGRAVRVKSQLTSHKRFASAFPSYCNLVDNARLYSTNSMGSSPQLIAWKDSSSDLLVDSERFRFLKKLGSLNEQADSVTELYTEAGNCGDFACIFKDVVLSPTRRELQKELKTAVQELEKSTS